MKKILGGITVFLISSILLITIPRHKAYAQDVMVSYQSFYDQLAPYGQWVYDPNFGDVFVPNVPPGFRPYATDGYWALTDDGNMWMSSEPWGWACYHYGRWTYNGYYGWVWIPGYQWAPSWVVWRNGGGVYGWAPMGPGYVPGAPYAYPDNYWVFVDPVYLYHPHIYEYYGHESPAFYMSRTTYYNETYGHGEGVYYSGPRRDMVERDTHQPVQVYHVAAAAHAGEAQVGGNQISIYRPAVNRETINTARPANVIQGGAHPIERTPQPIAPNHATAQPEFRQQMEAHNQGGNMQQHQQVQQPAPQQHQQAPEPAPQQHQQFQQHQQAQQPAPQQHQQTAQPAPQHQQFQQPAPQQHQQTAQPAPQHQQFQQHQQAQQPAPQQHQQAQPAPQHQQGQPQRQPQQQRQQTERH